MAPRGTPGEIVQKVNRDLRIVLDEPQVQRRFAQFGTYVRALTPEETAEFIRREQELWWPVAKQLDLKRP
jgi:tripartite-type tricarboxylate transporter receptor subunit TctC